MQFAKNIGGKEYVKDRNFKLNKEAQDNDHQIKAGDGGVMSGI